MALLSYRQLNNSTLIVNLSPKLSLFFLVQSSPRTFGFWQHACQTSPSKPVPARSDSFSHFPSLLSSYLAIIPYPIPILITLVFYLYFSFFGFLSAKAVRAVMFTACKVYKAKKRELCLLNYREFILLTFKQSWHLRAQYNHSKPAERDGCPRCQQGCQHVSQRQP